MLAAEAKRSWSEAKRLVKAEAVRVVSPVEPPGTGSGGVGQAGGVGPFDGLEPWHALVPGSSGVPGVVEVPAGGAAPEAAAAAGGNGSGAWRLRPKGRRRWVGARERARRMVQQARAEAQAIREAAREEGFRAGFEAGQQAGREQALQEVTARLQALVQRLEQAAEEALRRRDRALALAEEDVVKLALAVAERLVRREVAAGPEVTAAVVRSVLQEMPAAAAGRVVVRLNPDEHQMLAVAWTAGRPGELGPVHVEWVADPGVEPGGCVIETEMGTIDAGLETRLTQLASGLLDAMRHGG